MSASKLQLGLPGFSYPDLFTPEGLGRLDEQFCQRLEKHDSTLLSELQNYRGENGSLAGQALSEFLLKLAPVVEAFIAELFQVQDELSKLKDQTLEHDPVFKFKKLFVQRRARRRLLKKEDIESFGELDEWLSKTIDNKGSDRELAVASYAAGLLEDVKKHEAAIEQLTRWCIRAMTVIEGQAAVKDWVSFQLPQGTDYDNLVPIKFVDRKTHQAKQIDSGVTRRRDGFDLTDTRMNQRQVQSEVDYCIYCHDHDGDFCSIGFPEKKGEPELGLKTNPLGVILTGCPLDEKISEMHLLKKDGLGLASLAMIMVDNPMCPATGHRICNDCMKACVYQKQTPVNIPEIETRILTDVLSLPWGVEIYDLLTRWNPLRQKQWILKSYNGLKILVAGMGPAGFTLAHHLTMEGFAIVGVDGLKIEPLPEDLVNNPIRDYRTLEERLGERTLAGFGGVAEYGITVRWDKNFLKLIYLSLLRRRHFQVFGGVRFGGTFTLENAWELGFDHTVIAVGAGLPQALPIPGSLAPGMRQAADFLMALQLTGAAKDDSLANLQVRMPAVVIGGGLTGVDAATEVRAYYLKQVEKIFHRYTRLAEVMGEKQVRQGLDEYSLSTLDEYLEHGRAVKAERDRATKNEETPDFQPLIEQWGGVSIVYRRPMKNSPAYIRNHEEIIKAMEEGIDYADQLSPLEAKLDRHGHVASLECERMAVGDGGKLESTGEQVSLPARTILVATGARPNVAYHFEHRGAMEVKNMQYQTHQWNEGELKPVERVAHCKDPEFGAFTSYSQGGHLVSFIGDVHPDFNGNVVKAVASGQRIYPRIVESFGKQTGKSGDTEDYARFRDEISDRFRARVVSVTRHTPTIVELVVRAPMAAERFKPGQIFRLQNYETRSEVIGATRLQTETLPLTGSRVDKDKGEISFIIKERGTSTKICSTLKPDDPLILMGPAGVRTRIDENATVLIAGDWLAATVARSLAPALKQASSRVILAVQLPEKDEVFCREELERVCDAVIWKTDGGSLVDAIKGYGENSPVVALQDVDSLHITGTSEVVKNLNEARKAELSPLLTKNPATTGSVYSTMQCMLKGVCSQCLQWQVDPETGKRNKAVFACSWQDEPIDLVDFGALDDRLVQNRLQEHLSNLWLEQLFSESQINRA